MKPLKFPGYNVVFAKDQPPYLPLPAYQDCIQGGRVFHCWKLTWKERFHILYSGKLWINVLNFGKPLQPIKPMVENPFRKGD